MQVLDEDTFLSHGVAVTHSHCLVLEGFKVNGDAKRGADLILTAGSSSTDPDVAFFTSIEALGGRFVVAEECSGVKFLIAMVALATLAAWTGFSRWWPRILLVIGAALVSILANGVRAWGTIFVAQWVGAERAGGFDHIVYGWVFFAVVIVVVLGLAWRHFDREPAEAGLSAAQVAAHPLVRFEKLEIAPATGLLVVALGAIAFAVPGLLV